MKKKVLAIMLVAVSIMLISACGKKEKLYEIPDLSQYKTDYVGDSSNVINIVSGTPKLLQHLYWQSSRH